MDWRPLTTSRDPKYTVKGTELAYTFVEGSHRFAIVETRALDAEGNLDVIYRVRDAHTVNDAEVAGGKKPEVVHTCLTLAEAVQFVEERV